MQLQRRRLLCCLVWLALPAAAQDSAAIDPLRTSRDAVDERLMLDGHDPVAYFTRDQAVPGNPAIKLEHRGVVLRFASEANRSEFQKSPERYMPQLGGWCANGINYAVPWGGGGGASTWRIYRGKLYVFGGQKARDHFEMETEVNLERAHRYWRDEVAGANPLITRWRRLIFRVPHYKTDKALQDEYEGKLAAGSLPVMPGQPQVVPAR